MTTEAEKQTIPEAEEPVLQKAEEQTLQKAEETVQEDDDFQPKEDKGSKIFALKTTANREDQVVDFIGTHAEKKGFEVYSVIRPHGMRGYIFLEAISRAEAEQAAYRIPYAGKVLPSPVSYKEIEHMLEQVKRDVNIQKNDIVEIISGPFKGENAKVSRVDKMKEDVVVELVEAAVPIPITVKIDSVKVIRRDTDDIIED
ncbi:MAG: transcription elongation factor Spt5 [Nanoarchaeota archaeon]|nr:transcription elongation factor Spt5 [Nanoarchaeota archaeon]